MLLLWAISKNIGLLLQMGRDTWRACCMTTQVAATQSLDKLRTALIAKFPPKKVDEVLYHYNILRREDRLNHWESCLVNGGKCVEAVLKCFRYLTTGAEVDSVKADEEIRRLENAVHLSDF